MKSPERKMSADGAFGIVEPFELDDGSLNGLRPEYIFVLGVEWAMFRQQLDAGAPFKASCLPENRARFVKMAERHNRFVEDRDTGHAWSAEIWVGDHI
jgi:hypothetical protein